MKAEIVQIGNSKGIRIPKLVLDECKLQKTVNLEIRNHTLIITPFKEARENWEENFQLMAKNKDDNLLDSDSIETFWEQTEWQW